MEAMANERWDSTVLDIGTVAEKSTTTVVFKYKADCYPEKLQIHPACGCTSVLWKKEQKELHAKVSVKRVPKHLNDSYQLSKSIKLKYICAGTDIEEVLRITGTVSKNI